MQYLVTAKSGWNTVVSADSKAQAIAKVHTVHDEYGHDRKSLTVHEIIAR